MKLILKSKQEIEISSMNNAYAMENFKDGKGNDLNYNSIISFYAGKNESFESIKMKIAGDNTTDFVLFYNNTKRSFPGWKIESIIEDISDDHELVTIKLGRI